jgi:hypothetical protein
MFERLKLVGGSALAFSALVGLAVHYVEPKAGAAAQVPRQVRLPIATKIEPVVITKVNFRNVAVQSGRFARSAESAAPTTLFVADDDWVQGLTVYFLNRTNRAIAFVALRFSFPETTVGRVRYSFPLTLGTIPPSESFNLDGTAANHFGA